MSILHSCAAAALLSTLVACATTTTPALQGDDIYGPAAGESEFTFGGSVGKSTTTLDLSGVSGGLLGELESTTTSYDAQVGYGHYLTNSHEIGGQLVVNLLEQETEFDLSNLGGGGGAPPSASATIKSGQYGLYPYYRLNFRPNNRLQYYVGGHAGFQEVETAFGKENAFSYGGHVGFKSWLTPNVSFFVEPRLTLTTVSVQTVDQDITEFRTLFGFTFSY